MAPLGLRDIEQRDALAVEAIETGCAPARDGRRIGRIEELVVGRHEARERVRACTGAGWGSHPARCYWYRRDRGVARCRPALGGCPPRRPAGSPPARRPAPRATARPGLS